MKNYYLSILLFGSFMSSFGQLFLSEDFSGEQFPPVQWTLESADEDFTWFKSNFPQSAAIIENKDVLQDESLITPSMNLANVSEVFLDFQGRFVKQFFEDENLVSFIVSISLDSGSTWESIWDDSEIIYPTSGIFQSPVSIDVSGFTGSGSSDVQFKFTFTSVIHNSPFFISFQLFQVSVSTCKSPASISVFPSITWSQDESFSGTTEIEYGPQGFIQGTGTQVTGIAGNTYTIPTMDCNSFDFFLRSNCGDNPSPWSPRVRRSHVIGTLTRTDLTSSEVTIKWNGLESSTYQLEYGPLGFEEGSGINIANIDTFETENQQSVFSQQLTNLAPCTTYTARVKNQCTTSDAWTVINFTTETASTTPLIVPFQEAFDNDVSICSLGYAQNFNIASVTNNELQLNFINLPDYFLHSRPISMLANQQYSFEIDARILNQINETSPVQVGFISIKKEAEPSFEVELFSFMSSELSVDVFSTFSATFMSQEAGNYYLNFNVLNSASLGLKNLSVTENTLSVFNNEAINFSIYPNPSSSMITILALQSEFKAAQLFDIKGKNVLTSFTPSFSVEELLPGIYIVKIETISGQISTHKLVKK